MTRIGKASSALVACLPLAAVLAVPVVLMIDEEPPTTPTNLTATVFVKPVALILTWNYDYPEQTDPVEFVISRSVDITNWITVTNLPQTARSYRHAIDYAKPSEFLKVGAAWLETGTNN